MARARTPPGPGPMAALQGSESTNEVEGADARGADARTPPVDAVLAGATPTTGAADAAEEPEPQPEPQPQPQRQPQPQPQRQPQPQPQPQPDDASSCAAFVVAAAVHEQRERDAKAAVEADDCAICLGPPREPCTLACQHTFCTACVAELREKGVSDTCPLCRAPLPKGPEQLYALVRWVIMTLVCWALS